MIYFAFLRGINVSGSRLIPMASLKALFESLGFKNIQTYIQSGNVLFTTETQDPILLSLKIESAILEKFGFEVPVFIRTFSDLTQIIKRYPFKKDKDWDVKYAAVAFLNKVPALAVTTQLIDKTAKDFEPDRFLLQKTEIYLLCPKGFGKTKLTNNYFEKKLAVNSTIRNWNTIVKMVELATSVNAV